MFDKEQKRGYKQSARNLGNWHYDNKEDSYTHPDGWCYRFHHIKHQKTQTDFQQEIKVYYADDLNQLLKRDSILMNAIST